MAQWLRLRVSSAGAVGSTRGRELRSRMPHGQNIYILTVKRKKKECVVYLDVFQIAAHSLKCLKSMYGHTAPDLPDLIEMVQNSFNF